jgi:AraC-like DNA-binding protein
VELSRDYLARQLRHFQTGLHPMIRSLVESPQSPAGVGPVEPLTPIQVELVNSLRTPPVAAQAQRLWFEGKADELMAHLLFRPEGEDFFCTRQHRLARERSNRVIEILRRTLAEPPSLEAIGREIGCSPYYLSRTFSGQMGVTIPQYLRKLRMERAAELLGSGQCNVTEAALEVGYSSLSHFSSAFQETFGCCPGLYPIHHRPTR